MNRPTSDDKNNQPTDAEKKASQSSTPDDKGEKKDDNISADASKRSKKTDQETGSVSFGSPVRKSNSKRQTDPLVSNNFRPNSNTPSTVNRRNRKDTQILSESSLMRRTLNNQQGNDSSTSDEETTSKLGETREVILLVRGMVERIVMSEGVTYKMGRFDLGAAGEDEIDLTPYGAMDRGVSRIHATLHLRDDQLFITDLDSTNGTYIAGSRIDPHEATVLRKGDELLLGRLAVQVLFR